LPKGHSGIVKIKAESAAEVGAAFRMLEQNRRLLSGAYLDFFSKLSEHHEGEHFFRPSFLVPPPHVLKDSERQQELPPSSSPSSYSSP
jgi:hypothetical protein